VLQELLEGFASFFKLLREACLRVEQGDELAGDGVVWRGQVGLEKGHPLWIVRRLQERLQDWMYGFDGRWQWIPKEMTGKDEIFLQEG
jgi:hypothetical protein